MSTISVPGTGNLGTGVPRRSLRRRLRPLWFLAPSIVVFLALAVYPTIEAFITSLSRYNLTESDAHRTFIGLENFRTVFADSAFWGDLGRSFVFVIASVLVSLLLGFYIASLLFRTRAAKGIYRVLFLVPMAVSPTITALTFKFLLNYEFGVLNQLADALFGVRFNLLGRAETALWATVGIDVWQWTPLVILILLAGLESLPEEPYEAAALDGAGTWSMLRYITLPLMGRFILIASLIRIMDAFRVYETIQLTTAGGPGTVSETLNVYVAKVGFSFFEMGRASAMALLLNFLVIAISTVLVRRARAFGEEAA